MGLITETFADKQKKITPAHEPLSTGEKPALKVMPASLMPTGVQVTQPVKIAIVGTAPSSRMLAPYSDPSWQIWACSPGNMNQIPRFDVWFEMHSNLLWPEYESYGKPYVEWLRAGSFPVYMQDQSLVPHATTYPILEMCEEFGDDFFTSSFAYMMALAISKGAKEIGLYGVDMASRDEYITQRSGGRYFINEAKKRGITIHIPYESDLGISTPLYGYIDSTNVGRKLAARDTEVGGRVNQMQNQINELQQNSTYLKGAREDIDYMRSIQVGAENERILLRAKVARLEDELRKLKETG